MHLRSAAIDADSNFRERGYALFFRKPTRQVERAVLALGRVFGQVSGAHLHAAFHQSV